MAPATLGKIGAVFFITWGVVHVIGGVAILQALSAGADSGYAVYQGATGPFPAIAGSVLGYLAYTFAWIGALVAGIGATMNWKNSELGLGLNTVLVGLTDMGLIFYLVRPGYVSWAEASVGLGLFVVAAVVGGLGCTRAEPA